MKLSLFDTSLLYRKKKISFHTEQKKFFVMSCRNDASHILRCLPHLKRCNNDGILAVKCSK